MSVTREQMIEEALRVESIHKKITRNIWDKEATIGRRIVLKEFGTMTEFFKQAGLAPTRHQTAMDNAVAKHVSMDSHRAMSESRKGLDKKYVRTNSNRHKTIIVASDLHDKECDPFYLRVLIEAARKVQPDVFVFGGDIFDLPEFGKYGVDPREWDVVGRIQYVHQHIFKPIREACPNAQIDFIEGNHEARLLKHLAEASGAMRAVLSDLHGWTVANLLGLNKFGINYIAQADLKAWNKGDLNRELRKNYAVYFDRFAVHHTPEGRSLGLPGCHGHHHRYEAQTMFNHGAGSYIWHQLGCGHVREASYCDGSKWNLGFLIAHIDTGVQRNAVVPEYIAITDKAIVGGEFFYRQTDEV